MDYMVYVDPTQKRKLYRFCDLLRSCDGPIFFYIDGATYELTAASDKTIFAKGLETFIDLDL